MPSIHVIGGGAGIGRLAIDTIFAQDRVYCYDLNRSALDQCDGHIIGCHVASGADYSAYAGQFAPRDWIVYAAPSHAMDATVRAIAPFLAPEALVISLTSVQSGGAIVLGAALPPFVSWLGCHLLFGASLPSASGHAAALIGFDASNDQHSSFRRRLCEQGVLVTELTPTEHDEQMAVVQALTHFALFAFASTMVAAGRQPSELWNVRTPTFEFAYAFASRVLKISPTTTGAIQFTPQARALRTLFLERTEALAAALDQQDSEHGCAAVIEALREAAAGLDIDEGAELAAAMITPRAAWTPACAQLSGRHAVALDREQRVETARQPIEADRHGHHPP